MLRNPHAIADLKSVQGSQSPWFTFLQTLPYQTNSPLLWSESERQTLLRGSSILKEAAAREASLQEEWSSIEVICATHNDKYSPGRLSTVCALLELQNNSYNPGTGMFHLTRPKPILFTVRSALLGESSLFSALSPSNTKFSPSGASGLHCSLLQ